MSLISPVFLCATLAAVSVVDLRRRIIPNRVLLAAVAFWLGLKVWPGGEGTASSLVAAVVIASPLLLVALIRPDGIGMGDVKLVAVIALYLGWSAWLALLAGLFLAGLTGVLISLGRRRPPSETSLPLAPFLAVGTLPVVVSMVLPLQ